MYVHHLLPSYKLPCSYTLGMEGIWVEVVKNTTKYIIGGIYHHPDKKITDFKDFFEAVLVIYQIRNRQVL